MLPSAPTSRFAVFVTVLLDHLAHYGHQRRVPGPLLVLVWNRIRAIQAQVAGIIARIEAGTQRRYPNRRRPQTPTARHRPRTPPVLPLAPLWLVRLVQETVRSRSLLQDWMAEPVVAAMIENTPQLRRALRPLCRMLDAPLATPPPPDAPSPSPSRPAPDSTRPPQALTACPVRPRTAGPAATRQQPESPCSRPSRIDRCHPRHGGSPARPVRATAPPGSYRNVAMSSPHAGPPARDAGNRRPVVQASAADASVGAIAALRRRLRKCRDVRT